MIGKRRHQMMIQRANTKTRTISGARTAGRLAMTRAFLSVGVRRAGRGNVTISRFNRNPEPLARFLGWQEQP